MNIRKLSLAALGLSAALAAGSAAAAIIWNPTGTTLFEDDDLDFLYDSQLNAKASGTIVEGDVFISVFELNSGGGGDILPQELTGIIGIQVDTITDIGGGFANITFGAYDGGLDAILALGSTDQTVTGGGANGGALFASWLTDNPDLEISADNVVAGTVSCTSLSQCIDQAVGVDATIWEIDGFTGVDGAQIGDEFWIANNVLLDTSVVALTEPGIELGAVNAGLSILENNTGQDLALNSIACFPFCGGGPGLEDDGFVDIIGSGSIKGGLGLSDGLIADGGVATSDFDLQKRSEHIPEPGTLALLAMGFLGVGAAQRRRRKA